MEENSQLKKNTLVADKPNPRNSEPEQSSPMRESYEQPDRQNSNQQYLSQPPPYSPQPRPPYPPSSPQFRQSNQQHYPQPVQPYPPHPPQPRQYAPNQCAPQVSQTYQQYPSQPGQCTAPPTQYQHVHYGPNQPQGAFVIYVPPQPKSAQDTPAARPGIRPSESEPQLEGWTNFGNSQIRRTFVRKVYIILALQLLLTMGIIALFVFEPHVKDFLHRNLYLYYVSMAVFIAVYIGLACFQSLRRNFPSNLIALIVFTLAMSCMLGIISSFHKTEAVLIAAGICASVCLVVTIFSFYTKIDFTSCGAILCILLLILILFGLIAIFMPSKVMTLIYAGTGATVFTLFLAYDTQMLMGGKTVEISPEEYIFAAVQIYLDVAYIFLFILTITAVCND